jgi:hypothetical protein
MVMMSPPVHRPSLAKTREAPLFATRTFVLFHSSDARWAELFEKADVVSEGAPLSTGDDRVYYGSTNILLSLPMDRAGQTPETMAAAVARDPHVRVRALRAARREAAQRAQGPLDRLTAEITVTTKDRDVVVHVEVEARVFADRRLVPRTCEGVSAEVDLREDA